MRGGQTLLAGECVQFGGESGLLLRLGQQGERSAGKPGSVLGAAGASGRP